MKAHQSVLGQKILSDEKSARKILKFFPKIKIIDRAGRKLILKKVV
jgi:hypothetical protein